MKAFIELASMPTIAVAAPGSESQDRIRARTISPWRIRSEPFRTAARGRFLELLA